MCVSRRHCGWFSDLRTLVYGFAAECSSNREFSHCMKIYHSSALLLFSSTSACLFRFNAQVCFCFLYFIKGKPFGSAYREGNLSKSFVVAYAWVIADRLRDVEGTCDGRYVLLRAPPLQWTTDLPFDFRMPQAFEIFNILWDLFPLVYFNKSST